MENVLDEDYIEPGHIERALEKAKDSITADSTAYIGGVVSVLFRHRNEKSRYHKAYLDLILAEIELTNQKLANSKKEILDVDTN